MSGRKDDINDNTNNMLSKYLYSLPIERPLLKSRHVNRTERGLC